MRAPFGWRKVGSGSIGWQAAVGRRGAQLYPHQTGQTASKEDLAGETSSIKRLVTPSLVKVGREIIGGSKVTWVAGPRFVESTAQIVAVADALQRLGVRFLRAGTFRRKTGRSEFTALGLNGLKILHIAAKRFGLKIVSEVVDLRDLRLMRKYCDVIEVCSTNTSNIGLLCELGYSDTTVIVHRNPTMTLDDYLKSLEYIQKGKNAKVILAENGICGFEPKRNQVLDLSSIITLKERTSRPVFVDCGKLASSSSHVERIAGAAVAAGADGIMTDLSTASMSRTAAGEKAISAGELVRLIRRTKALKYTLDALTHSRAEAEEEQFERRLLA